MKTDIIRGMKLLAALMAFPVTAFAVTVEPLPPCEYADTEVSTNFSVVVDFDRMNRMDFTLSLVPSRSNSVEVAVGADRNGDGNLAPEEAAYVFGCDCCQWFVRERDQGLGIRDQDLSAPAAESSGGTERVEKTFILKRRLISESWDTVKVTRRGLGATDEIAEVRKRRIGIGIFVR
jgi:hypothetical protein